MAKKFASGILPIAADTKNICLAWRSPEIRQGDVWGVIGGMVKDGLSMAAGAILEMGEEVGYYGPLELHTAHVMRQKKFEYHSFIGIVPTEFDFNPEPEFAFETSHICWLSYERIHFLVRTAPKTFHPGLLDLLQASDDLIRSLLV